jgi:ABC-type multidrug transport system permease subunit
VSGIPKGRLIMSTISFSCYYYIPFVVMNVLEP